MSDTNNVPNRKIVVGAAASAGMIIVTWISKQFAGVEIPTEVAMAMSTIVVFFVQYFVPNAEV